MNIRIKLLIVPAVVASLALVAHAETNSVRFWPQWRGPLANGVAPHANPPTVWSETKNIRWKLALPGKGHSSPIVFGDRVYVMAAAPIGEAQKPVHDSAPGVHDSVPVTHRHQYLVMAISRSAGHVLWKKVVREEWPHEGGHDTGSPASNSPVTDGQFIYAFFGSRGLYCLDTNGAVLWQKDLGKMQTLHAHGEGSSPVLHGETLTVNWDHEGDSFLYAFDKRTGKQLWRTPRDEKTSWSTPLIVEHEGKPQIIVSATKRVRGYDLATGKQLWECAGLTDNVVASPVHTRGVVIAGNSYYQQAMVAIRLAGAKGDITGTSNVAWSLNRLTPYVSSPLLYDDTLYFLRHNQNILSRLDPMTGEPRGEPLRLDGIRDHIFSSPVGAAGRIYVTARDGRTVVLRRDRDNAMLAVNQLNDTFSATAALADRELYLRGEKFLYCISEGFTKSEHATPTSILEAWQNLPTTDKLVRSLAERAPLAVDLSFARNWAAEFARTNPKRNRIGASDIPDTIRNLEPTSSPFGDIERADDGSTAVFILWGGGFGKWGLAFTTNQSLLMRRWIVTQPVTNGVHSFVTTDPH